MGSPHPRGQGSSLPRHLFSFNLLTHPDFIISSENHTKVSFSLSPESWVDRARWVLVSGWKQMVSATLRSHSSPVDSASGLATVRGPATPSPPKVPRGFREHGRSCC